MPSRHRTAAKSDAVASMQAALVNGLGEWAILTGLGWATAPTLDGGESTSPISPGNRGARI